VVGPAVPAQLAIAAQAIRGGELDLKGIAAVIFLPPTPSRAAQLDLVGPKAWRAMFDKYTYIRAQVERRASCTMRPGSRQSSVVSRQLTIGRRRDRSPLVALCSRRRAFTLVELLVVLMIMSILGAAALPTVYRSLEQQRLESAARRVKQDLEQLRQTARTKSKTETLTFTTATAYTLSSDVKGLDRRSQTYAVELAASPYGVSNVSTTSLGSPATVSFDGYGATTASGTVVLQMGGYKRTVTLDPSTGQAAITNN
jgi:prepilin-type N-terminal cleavage/methylation domain-containing protein